MPLPTTSRAKSASIQPSVTAQKYDIARRLAYWAVKSCDIQKSEVTYTKALSWAKLENELSLSNSFTICSDVTWQDPRWGSGFFTVLGQNGSNFLTVGTIYDDNQGMTMPFFALKNEHIEGTDTKLAANSSKVIGFSSGLTFQRKDKPSQNFS